MNVKVFWEICNLSDGSYIDRLQRDVPVLVNGNWLCIDVIGVPMQTIYRIFEWILSKFCSKMIHNMFSFF